MIVINSDRFPRLYMTLFLHQTCTYLHGRADRFFVLVSNGQVAALSEWAYWLHISQRRSRGGATSADCNVLWRHLMISFDAICHFGGQKSCSHLAVNPVHCHSRTSLGLALTTGTATARPRAYHVHDRGHGHAHAPGTAQPQPRQRHRRHRHRHRPQQYNYTTYKQLAY